MGERPGQGERASSREREKVSEKEKTDGRKVGGRDNSKHRGNLAEMKFMLKAASLGMGVAKPYGDNERYDVLVDAGGRFRRVQVKSSGARHHRGFTVRACWRTSRGHRPYTAAQIDFLAAVIAGTDIWYVIPVRALRGRLTIHLYPFGCRRGSKEEFEKYRERWQLLEGKRR
jgi:hypothetical protein